MRVAILCEESGVVRRAFRARGHEAWSFDLLPARDESTFHVIGDIRETFVYSWDLVIAFPPCTHLAVSGARWFKDKREEQDKALEFVRWIMNIPVEKIAVENPISIISTHIRKPDQIIQPWMFGHGELKRTCFWLKGLPFLVPTKIVDGREPRVHLMSPGPTRSRDRSETYQGIADAMADQWGSK